MKCSLQALFQNTSDSMSMSGLISLFFVLLLLLYQMLEFRLREVPVTDRADAAFKHLTQPRHLSSSVEYKHVR